MHQSSTKAICDAVVRLLEAHGCVINRVDRLVRDDEEAFFIHAGHENPGGLPVPINAAVTCHDEPTGLPDLEFSAKRFAEGVADREILAKLDERKRNWREFFEDEETQGNPYAEKANELLKKLKAHGSN